jgi:hypothetical protein
MKTLTALALLLALAPLAFAEMRDPAPVVSEEEGAAPDGRHYVGIFDFVRPSKTVCENGVCRTVPATASSPAPVASSPSCACGDACPCGSAATAATATRFRPLANTLERIRSWYPGKAFRAFFGR